MTASSRALEHAEDRRRDDAPVAARPQERHRRSGQPGPRISDFDELRDGGFGVGSAAPLDDGAQPLDHPVQAYRDTMTYDLPGDPGYDSAEPHVWFYDEARRRAQRLPALRAADPRHPVCDAQAARAAPRPPACRAASHHEVAAATRLRPMRGDPIGSGHPQQAERNRRAHRSAQRDPTG